MNKLLVFSKELLEWAQSLPNVVIPAGLESDVQEAIAEVESAQPSVERTPDPECNCFKNNTLAWERFPVHG